jgi:hypothetical protein
MKIADFVQEFKDKKIKNTTVSPNAVSEYLKDVLEIKTYLPFRAKRQIAEMVVTQNIKEVNGVKKYDSIDGYIGLIVASIVAHTNLEFSSDPLADYDLLAESGLLPQIIMEFQESHNEIDTLLKMTVDAELEDNNIEVLIGHFLDKILKQIDNLGDALKEKFEDFNLQNVFGADFNEEDLAKLSGFIDKLK